jgi:hypothetical protein
MTLDFISEVIAGMGKALSQRINCLQYMSPWIKNLAYFPNPTSPHYEHSGARLRDCIRALTDLTLNQAEVRGIANKNKNVSNLIFTDIHRHSEMCLV